ncbi:MAG: dihydroorotate dehydrogenase electron transfer subunit [Acidobacteria bacterium]|nr:dihydroorotate dehydrogenase electron transfer subunit [Acidobacteriota bacterium]
MPYNLTARVETQTDLGSGYFLLRAAAPEIAREVRAGQFVMIGPRELDHMLIRRPFSVALVDPEPGAGPPRAISVLFKVVGRGTANFSHLKPGDELAVLGPLGRGYWRPAADGAAEVIGVAGGIGNASFPLLLQQMGERARQVTFFFGGRTAADLTLLDWFRGRCGSVVVATEDGSAGAPGLVTGPLARHLDAEPGRPRVVLACGPRPMLRAVTEICRARDIPCQLAMEETMACGFGVCLGCVVPKRQPEGEFDTYVRVCTEGPVFDAREVVP